MGGRGAEIGSQRRVWSEWWAKTASYFTVGTKKCQGKTTNRKFKLTSSQPDNSNSFTTGQFQWLFRAEPMGEENRMTLNSRESFWGDI